MLRLRRACVAEALLAQVLVHLGQVVVALCEAFSGLGHNALAGAAYRHDGQARPLRDSEVARVEGVAQALVLLLKNARSRARSALHYLRIQLDAQNTADLYR